MGTRNLTAVMVNGEYKIAQYGQWDGYPSGQGKTALEFCCGQLATQEGRDAFRAKLATVRWIKKEEVYAALTAVGSPDGWLNLDQGRKFDELCPYLSRNHGAGILDMVMEATDDVAISNSIDFAGDSLFCEWAYVIELDKLMLEAYKGFNKRPVPPGERFANAPVDERLRGQYYPVRLVGTWSLDALPSFDEFKAQLEPTLDENVDSTAAAV